jgi:hypothetical protein
LRRLPSEGSSMKFMTRADIKAWWLGTWRNMRKPETWAIAAIGIALEAFILLIGASLGAF